MSEPAQAPGFFEELRRRKVFKVGAAYLVVAWVAVQAAGLGFPAFGAPDWALRVFILVALLGFPVSLVFAWAFETSPEGLRSDTPARGGKFVLAGAVALIALAFLWYFKAQPAVRDGKELSPAAAAVAAAPINRKSIAVLPFTDLSPGHDQEYFSDGIAEEILNALAQVRDLKVAGRTSSFHFKGRNDDLRTIGKALGVAHVLEGSVRKQGDKVRITAQLIQTEDGFHVWSESFDGDLKDVFALQEKIARSITDKLQVVLSGEQDARLVNAGTQDTEAYSQYLRATQIFNRRDPTRMAEARALLLQAVARDPKFARGFSRLAAVEAISLNYFPGRIDEFAATTEAHAHQATALDPSLAEPYAALGSLYSRQRRYLEAVEQYEKALSLDPNDVTSNFWYGTFLAQTGYEVHANQQFDKTLAIDPLLPNALLWRGMTSVCIGDLQAGKSFMDRAAESGIAHLGLGQSDLSEAAGNLKLAGQQLAAGYEPFASDLPPGATRVLAAAVYGDADARLAMHQIADAYLAKKPAQVSGPLIDALLRGGQPQRALKLLAKGPSANDAMLFQTFWKQGEHELRKLPEFAEFLTASGLTRLWDAQGNPDICKRQPDGRYACD